MDSVTKFVKERNEALLSLDEIKIKKFSKKYGVTLSDNPLVFWAFIHKARIEIASFSEEVKEESRNWLLSLGFKPGICYPPDTT